MVEQQGFPRRKKIITMVACQSGMDRDRFRQRYLNEVGPLLVSHCPPLRRLAINLADVNARIRVRSSVKQPFREVNPPPFDVVTEMWFDSFDEFKDPSRLFDSAESARLFHTNIVDLGTGPAWSYLIVEVMQWDRTPLPRLGERSPGIKCLMPTRRPDGISAKDAEAVWRNHRIVASQYHRFATRYGQNGVVAALETDAPVIHGLADLYFPTKEDLEERFFGGNEEGEAAIAADAAPFVADSYPLYLSEYVLKA
jgi:EthD domain